MENQILKLARLLYRRFAGRRDIYCVEGYRGFEIMADPCGDCFPLTVERICEHLTEQEDDPCAIGVFMFEVAAADVRVSLLAHRL